MGFSYISSWSLPFILLFQSNGGDTCWFTHFNTVMHRLSRDTCFITKVNPGPKVINLFPCSTQHRMVYFLLINVWMPTIVGISTLMSRKNISLDISEPEKKADFLNIFYTFEHVKFLNWAWKKYYYTTLETEGVSNSIPTAALQISRDYRVSYVIIIHISQLKYILLRLICTI